MQITEHTSQVLRLRAKRISSGYRNTLLFIFGLPFFSAGFVFALLFGKLEALDCKRLDQNQITCEFVSSGLLNKKTYTIEQLQDSKVEVNSLGTGADTYRVVLIDENERIPLTEFYSSGLSIHLKRAREINAFIKDSEQLSYQFKEDSRQDAYGFGGLFMLVGCSFIVGFFMHKSLTLCTFDKKSGRLYLIYQNLINQSEVEEEKLDNIKISNSKFQL